MFRKLPNIQKSEVILDRAFKKSKKVKVVDRDSFYRAKKTSIAKVESFSMNIINNLENYVKNYPSIENLPIFYQELIEIKIKIDTLKKTLGAVNWAKNTAQKIIQSQVKSMKKSNNLNFIKTKEKEIYGRISSVVKQIDKDIDTLLQATKIMRVFPEVNTDIPTVVIAGYPNVGKSSLLQCLSAAKPKIAQYPFTTKEIHVGHISYEQKYEKKQIQLIDTPGLFDRPLQNRNNIEKQAINALANLSDVIIYVMDPTSTCGYDVEKQKKLLGNLKKTYTSIPFIVVENKMDISDIETKNMQVSCKNQEGINILKHKIIETIAKQDDK